jgi:hypothetical protein
MHPYPQRTCAHVLEDAIAMVRINVRQPIAAGSTVAAGGDPREPELAPGVRVLSFFAAGYWPEDSPDLDVVVASPQMHRLGEGLRDSP